MDLVVTGDWWVWCVVRVFVMADDWIFLVVGNTFQGIIYSITNNTPAGHQKKPATSRNKSKIKLNLLGVLLSSCLSFVCKEKWRTNGKKLLMEIL